MKTQTKIEILAMLMVGAAACGGDEKPNVSNTSSNNTQNNTQQNNTTMTPTNNTTTVTPDGAIALVSPTDEVVTNGDVTLVFEVGDDVESLTLRIDGEAGATVAAPYIHELDTSLLTEDRHSIGVEYVVDGETRRAEDLLSIVVDRSAPILLESLPVDGELNVFNGGPVRLYFSEALDPASLSDLSATIGGQTGTATIENDTDVLIDFDWASMLLPLDATLDYSGLRDAAGNATSGTISWSAPTYLSDSPGDLANPFWYAVDDTEYVIGSRRGATGAEIVAMRGETSATDNNHKDWIALVAVAADEIVDFDVAVWDGTAYIAAVTRPTAGNQLLLALYAIEAGATTVAAHGTRPLGAAATTSYTTSISAGPAMLHIALASTDDQVHDVFTINHGGLLAFQSVDLFPVMFNNTFSDTLQLGVSTADRAVMTFARCITATSPCTQTEVVSLMIDENGTWQQVAAPLAGTLLANAACERFDSVDTLIDGDNAYLAVSSRPNCRAGSTTDFVIYRAEQGVWVPMANNPIGATLPAGDYSGRIAKDPNGELLFVAQADGTVALGSISGAVISNVSVVSDGLDTAAGTFTDTRISSDGSAPIVSTVLGGSTLILRRNFGGGRL